MTVQKFETIKSRIAIHAAALTRIAERACVDPRVDVADALAELDSMTDIIGELDKTNWPAG